MSAEVTVKKRGRPSKKVQGEGEGSQAVWEDAAAPKTRAKATAKKSATSATSSAATPSSPVVTAATSVTTSTTATRKRTKETAEASKTVPATEKKSKAASTGKEKANAKLVKSSTPSSTEKDPATIAAVSKTTKRQIKPAESKSKSTAKSKSVAASVGATGPTTASASVSTVEGNNLNSATPAVEEKKPPRQKPQDITEKQQKSRQTSSAILHQATAFSQQRSTELGESATNVDSIRDTAPPSTQTTQEVTQAMPSIPLTSKVVTTVSASASMPQVRAYSSTSPLPMSTTVALASRQSFQQSKSSSSPSVSASPSSRSSRLPPSAPSSPTPASPARPKAAGPKLSDLTQAQLERDPRYKRAKTRYTALIVATPFLVVSSWMLWKKYQEHQVYLKKVEEVRRRGPSAVTDVMATTTTDSAMESLDSLQQSSSVADAGAAIPPTADRDDDSSTDATEKPSASTGRSGGWGFRFK